MHWLPRVLLSLVFGAMVGLALGMCAFVAVPIVMPGSGGFSENIASLGRSIVAFDVVSVAGGLVVAALAFRAFGPAPPAASSDPGE